MVILVTGATGFVGRAVVRALNTVDAEVRCLVRNPKHAQILTSVHFCVVGSNNLKIPSNDDDYIGGGEGGLEANTVRSRHKTATRQPRGSQQMPKPS